MTIFHVLRFPWKDEFRDANFIWPGNPVFEKYKQWNINYYRSLEISRLIKLHRSGEIQEKCRKKYIELLTNYDDESL